MLKIAFIGGGNMATALIGGLAGTLTDGANIHVVDLNAQALAKLQQQFSVSPLPATRKAAGSKMTASAAPA